MAEASLVISILALALSLNIAALGIWFQWRLSQESANQLHRAEKTLAKLEGEALRLRATQEAQFQQVLDAALAERKAEAKEASSDVRELKEQLEDLGRTRQQPDERLVEMQRIIEGLQGKLDKLQDSDTLLNSNRFRIVGVGHATLPPLGGGSGRVRDVEQ